MRPSRRAALIAAAFYGSTLLTLGRPGGDGAIAAATSWIDDEGFDASEFAAFEDDDEEDDMSVYEEDEEEEEGEMSNVDDSPRGYSPSLPSDDAIGGVDFSSYEFDGDEEPTPEPPKPAEEDEEENDDEENDDDNDDDDDGGDMWLKDETEAAAQAAAAAAAATASKLKAVACAAAAEADETTLEAARRAVVGAVAEARAAAAQWAEAKLNESAVEKELLTYAEFEDAFNEETAWAAAEFGEEAVRGS
jgi:hypothetical protein